jgi:hypothetical protein
MRKRDAKDPTTGQEARTKMISNESALLFLGESVISPTHLTEDHQNPPKNDLIMSDVKHQLASKCEKCHILGVLD